MIYLTTVKNILIVIHLSTFENDMVLNGFKSFIKQKWIMIYIMICFPFSHCGTLSYMSSK